MKRMILYGICVLLCFAFCGCSKRKATVEDEEKITELATKFNQAERNDDIPGMLKFANEMYSYASKLEPDEKGKRLLAGAYTKLGIVYSSQDKRAEAFKAWDTAISITPDADTIIYVYCLKLSDFWSQKYAEERNEIMEACRREYNKIRVTEKFRELSSYRQSVLTSYSGAVDSYCFSLLFVKDFSRMKQMILDFLTEFESEDDFGRQVDYSAALYFLLAEAFRGEKDYEEEQFYLKKSLYWAKRGKTVYEYLYLRLAVYELQQENYEQALAYCDSGLGSTKFISNRFHAESQAILLFAKSKIYEKMGRPEAAREYLEKSRKLHPSPNLRNGFNPLWIKM